VEFALLVLGFAPGLFWLWHYYRKDAYQPEPRRLVLKLFVLGMVVTIPVGIAEILVEGVAGLESATSLTALAISAFVVIGPIEEVAKFLVVYRFAYLRREFDEPVDGIVYAVATSLGFATVENVVHAVTSGLAVLAVRAVISTFGHVMFALPWGYGLGLAKCQPGGARRAVIQGLAFGALVHGLFDFLLFASRGGEEVAGALALLVLPLLLLLRWHAGGQVRAALARSPFRPRR